MFKGVNLQENVEQNIFKGVNLRRIYVSRGKPPKNICLKG